ncbi:unnamed protein product, partial [Brenthis ino]
MNELCTACLCAGRLLFYIEGTEIYKLYTQILREISITEDMLSGCVRVCWECRAMLHRVNKFKSQTQQCYVELMQHVNKNSGKFHNLQKSPHLQIHSIHNYSYPELVIKQEEPEDLAELDGLEDSDTHYEPETFVNDLEVEKEIKATKKKPKQKVKLKKKKAKECPEGVEEEPCLAVGSKREFVCQQCGEGFTSEEEMEKHVEKAHVQIPLKQNGVKKKTKEQLPEKPQCVECGKIFSSKKTYRYHLNVLHKGQNRYPCPRCGKVYQWKSNLGRHLRTHKARDAGELHCGACDKRFASVATFRQHLRVSRRHVSETDFTFMCNECGKKFVNKTRLRDHIDWEHLHNIKFRCQLCDKPFKCHTSLYVHMQNVHRNKEKKDNLCHVCGKSYQNAAKLKYHIVAMHTRETPYACAHCGAAFGWYSSLYRHVREVHYKMKVQPKKSKKTKKPPGDAAIP